MQAGVLAPQGRKTRGPAKAHDDRKLLGGETQYIRVSGPRLSDYEAVMVEL
jgi:hypothetical protein